MSVREHVNSFLAPIDPHGGLADFGARLLRSAQADADVRKALRSLTTLRDDFLDKLVFGGHLKAAEATVAPVLYLRALDAFASGSRQLVDVKGAVLRAVDGLAKLEPSFVTELLAAGEQRARRDAALAARLADARERFVDLANRLAPIDDRLCRLLEGSEHDTDGAPSTDGGGPTAQASGGGRCRDIYTPGTCAVIIVVVIVIIVVVTK